MAGSTIGNIFSVSTWGESHGVGIGVIIDGCPAGLPLCEDDIQVFLDRRKPGQSVFTTPRKEDDIVKIMSGVFEGKTTGSPISLFVYNQTQRSSDYNEIANYYRPGHADYTYDMKYGFRDYRGGGRSSGRETIGRVAAGAVAIKLLTMFGITFTTYTKSIGNIAIDYNHFDKAYISTNSLYMPDKDAYEKASEYVTEIMKEQDSAGGVVECIVSGVMPGLGNPVFDKLDANLAKAMISIGGAESFEIGDGLKVTQSTGSTNNDEFILKHGKIVKKTNHSGGTLGGISDGSDIVIDVGFKPTPSISKEQHTVTKDGVETTVSIHGRHDPLIVPRAVVVVESMCAITIVDALLKNMTSRVSDIVSFYDRK